MENQTNNRLDIFITKSVVISIIHFQDGSKELNTYSSVEKIEKQNSFNAVNVYFTDQNFTIVPEELFDAKKAADILKFSTSFNPELEKEFHSNLLAFNTFITWGSNIKLIDYITNIYPSTEFHHITELGIHKLFKQKENNLTIEIGDIILSGSKSKNQLNQISLNEGKALSDKVYFSLLPFQNTGKDQLITQFIGSSSLMTELKKFINIANFEEKAESNLLEII